MIDISCLLNILRSSVVIAILLNDYQVYRNNLLKKCSKNDKLLFSMAILMYYLRIGSLFCLYIQLTLHVDGVLCSLTCLLAAEYNLVRKV